MNEVEAASKLSPDDQFTEFVTKAKSIKATVIDQSGDEATVKIEVEGEDPEEMKFTKVEGKWIPAEIAEGWEENIAEAKQNMQDLPQELQQAKPQVMGGLAMVESVLDSMLKAESQQEFDQAIGGVLGLMGGGMSPPGGSGFGPAGGSGTSPDFEFDDLPEPDADDVDVDVEENEAEVEVPTGSAE